MIRHAIQMPTSGNQTRAFSRVMANKPPDTPMATQIATRGLDMKTPIHAMSEQLSKQPREAF
jgi:hypothetical protein